MKIILPKPRHEMNELESCYAYRLRSMQMAGMIEDYRYEAITFRLADRTTYSPDFLVIRPEDGGTALEIHEVKGYMREDANVKLKVSAKQFPWFEFFLAVRIRGEWQVKRV